MASPSRPSHCLLVTITAVPLFPPAACLPSPRHVADGALLLHAEHSTEVQSGHRRDTALRSRWDTALRSNGTQGGHSTEVQAGHSTEVQAGHSTQFQAGHSTEVQAGHSTQFQAGHSTEVQAGHSTQFQAGHSTEVQAGHSTEVQAGHSTQFQAGHSTEVQAGHSTEVQAVGRGSGSRERAELLSGEVDTKIEKIRCRCTADPDSHRVNNVSAGQEWCQKHHGHVNGVLDRSGSLCGFGARDTIAIQ